MNFPELRELDQAFVARLHQHGPISFQQHLYQLVKELEPRVVVETGTRKGISTILLRLAMPYQPEGTMLYSCDPLYRSQEAAEAAIKKATGFDLAGKGWTFLPGKSELALRKVPDEPSWDLFVHDSEHSAKVQSFELEYAWQRLRSGGVLVCDDWNTHAHARPHQTFLAWVETLGVKFETMGTAAMVYKPGAAPQVLEPSGFDV